MNLQNLRLQNCELICEKEFVQSLSNKSIVNLDLSGNFIDESVVNELMNYKIKSIKLSNTNLNIQTIQKIKSNSLYLEKERSC